MKKQLNVIQEDCCDSPVQPVFDMEWAKKFAGLLATVADPIRLQIINMLAQTDGEICVCDITAMFKVGQPTISHHLGVLRNAGIVATDKRGKWVYYSLVRSRLEEIQNSLRDVYNLPLAIAS
jgi:ArsR family transcriptional regulator, arsenate/arsenite/antimonite-responsive transcriptional repressor